MSFKKFYEAELSIQESLMTLYYVTNSNTLNESSELDESILDDFAGQVKAALPKFGVKIHKGSGLIDYLKKFTTVGGKILVAALQKDKEKIKELSKNVERAEFVDFLLKLDMVTMHLITGPIHMIDAVTGWDLMANIKAHAEKAEDIIKGIVHGIEDLKGKIVKVLDDNVAKPFIGFFQDLEMAITGKK